MMNVDHFNVLFLCTGNSARSVMAEAILNKCGHPRFSAFSAGSRPTGTVNPLTIELLRSLGYSTSTFRSKSWEEFTDMNSPTIDLVITVCDSAAAEPCPIWSGQPAKAHWSLPDPASVEGSHADRLKAFATIYRELERRIQQLISLPSTPIDGKGLKEYLERVEKEKSYHNRNRQ